MMVSRFEGYTLDNDGLMRYNNRIYVPPSANALPHNSQVGRSMSSQDLFFLLGPKNFKRFFYFPIGKSAPTENLRGIPSSHSGDQTSWIHEVSGQMLYSQIVET
jgi:hypothetical protein